MARLEAHYETVRERNGYDRVSGIDWLSDAGLDRRFVAVDGRETVEAALDEETIVCMGVGMTGPPHLGTVGQILTGIELQSAGLDVQFVVADLEPYHGGADLERVRRLAERSREFALDLGFDPNQGVLRTQEAVRAVMHTAELLAPYYAPGDWGDDSEADTPETDWESAVGALYEERASDDSAAGQTSEAASAHSSVLHGADFLHPLSTEGYEQVIVALGIDEHGLTPHTRRFRDAAPVEGAIAGLHSRMIPGFGDVPKMSKSVDAGVALDRTVRGTGGALLSSAVTTAAGFGVLAFSLLPALRQFGLVLAIGIGYAFVASVLVQPSLLALWARYGSDTAAPADASAATGDD